MPMRRLSYLFALLPFSLCAQGPASTPSPTVAKYIKVPHAPVIVLEHVRVIDGTGAPAMENQFVVIAEGTIQAISSTPPAADHAPAVHLDLTGRTIFPGLVGMHDHMYSIARPNMNAEGYAEPPLMVPEMAFSSPRLYLGAGVTTLRTTGSVEPYTDLNLRDDIDAGKLPGPHMDVTGPYLEGAKSPFIQMHRLKDAADARATVDFWAAQGVTSFKAYMNITREELKAAIEEAHQRGLKVTGHLCAVTYPEAAALGIDNLEHGFFVNTQLDPGKQPDVCPASTGHPTLVRMKAGSPEAVDLIRTLVEHHVAVTSTLPVFESMNPARHPLQNRVIDTMSAPAREAYLDMRNLELVRAAGQSGEKGRDAAAAEENARAFENGMALEREFVAAGGLLMAGPDPTGDGGTLPGFGDQREVELLVEAGFTPLAAIRIATLNGAIYMGRDKEIGSIAVGKHADLVVVSGDPSKKISDIENTEIVFKDGVGYDSQKLLESVKGRYGQY